MREWGDAIGAEESQGFVVGLTPSVSETSALPES